MIKKFHRIEGRCIEKIYGQDRFGYSQSDFEDLYDLIQWAEQGGYQGSELLFYDFYTGNVYKILYLIFNYPHKHYTFKHFEV